MGIIYKVENTITHKIYIGQTKYTLEKRWKQHIKESKEALNGIRQSFSLFHRMIIKYGEQCFIPSEIEECDDSLLDEREKYWIKQYNSYNDGYNKTFGGQTSTISHPSDVSEFSINGVFIKHYDSVSEASKEKNIAASNIRHCCNEDYKTCAGSIWQWGNDTKLKRELPTNTGRERPIRQLDKQNNFIKDFPSIAAAAKEVGSNYNSIYRVCRGRQKTAGGYKWEYI